jgi:hypothetical protein
MLLNKGNPKKLVEKLLQYHYIHFASQMSYLGLNPSLHLREQ